MIGITYYSTNAITFNGAVNFNGAVTAGSYAGNGGGLTNSAGRSFVDATITNGFATTNFVNTTATNNLLAVITNAQFAMPLFQDCIFAAPLSGDYNSRYPGLQVTGTPSGSGYFTNGLINSAYFTPDDNSYVDWGTNVQVSLTNFTVAVLINTTNWDDASSQLYLGKSIPAAVYYPWLITSYPFGGNGLLQFSVYTPDANAGVGRISTANYNWADGNWHLVVGTYNGTHTTLWVDGTNAVNVDTAQTTGAVTNMSWPIRCPERANQGTVGYPMIFNHAFNTNEVKLLKNYFFGH